MQAIRKSDWPELTAICLEGMKAAAERPGLYGGRHVARYFDKKLSKTVFVVLDDDDFETTPTDRDYDVMAQCTPTKVNAIGRCRGYLREDGTVRYPTKGGDA